MINPFDDDDNDELLDFDRLTPEQAKSILGVLANVPARINVIFEPKYPDVSFKRITVIYNLLESFKRPGSLSYAVMKTVTALKGFDFNDYKSADDDGEGALA